MTGPCSSAGRVRRTRDLDRSGGEDSHDGGAAVVPYGPGGLDANGPVTCWQVAYLVTRLSCSSAVNGAEETRVVMASMFK